MQCLLKVIITYCKLSLMLKYTCIFIFSTFLWIRAAIFLITVQNWLLLIVEIIAYFALTVQYCYSLFCFLTFYILPYAWTYWSVSLLLLYRNLVIWGQYSRGSTEFIFWCSLLVVFPVQHLPNYHFKIIS